MSWRVGTVYKDRIIEGNSLCAIAEDEEQATRIVALLNESDANRDKVRAFNLLLTAVNPTIRRLAERYLEGVKDYGTFVEFLRTHPLDEAIDRALAKGGNTPKDV